MAWYNPLSWLDDEQPTQENINASNIAAQPMQQKPPAIPQGQGFISDDANAALLKRSQDFPGMQQRGEDLASMRKRLENYLQVPGQTNLSPLMGLVDTWTGSNLAKTYDQPMSPEQRMMMANNLQSGINKEQTGLTSDQMKFYKDQLEGQGINNRMNLGQQKIDVSQQGVDQKGAGVWAPVPRAIGPNGFAVEKNSVTGDTREMTGIAPIAPSEGKASAANDKEFLQFGKELTGGTASSRSDFGRNQATITNARKISALGAQGDLQDKGLTVRQIHELAVATGALVSGGNAPAQSTVQALVPHSYGTSQEGIEEWLTQEPTGAGQQAFVKQMLETADREQHVATENIKGIKADVVATHSHLADVDPDRYKTLMEHHFGKGYQFLFDETGGYTPTPYQSKIAPPAMAATSSAYQPGSVMAGKGGIQYKFKGGDPRDKNNYEPITAQVQNGQ